MGGDDVKLLSLWSAATSGALRHALADGHAPFDERRLGELLAFLETNYLVQPKADGGSAALFRTASKREAWGPMWLLQRYMGMRFALWPPQAFLDAALPFVAILRSRMVVAAWMALTLLGFFLVVRQWDQFIGTFSDFLTPGGVLGYGVVLIALKCVHELGHAFAAASQGCRVGSMGVSVIMGMPMLYTRPRCEPAATARASMWIAAGGVVAESLVAVWPRWPGACCPTAPRAASPSCWRRRAG